MPEPDSPIQEPQILVPVSAEDFARQKRKRIYVWMAAILLAAGGAAWIYKRSTDPIRAQEAFDSGQRLLKIARFSQAILSFDTATGLKPDFADAYLLRGEARAGINDIDGAIVDFTKTLELRPTDTKALLERGTLLLGRKDFQGAMADCDQALRIDVRLAAARNLRATIFRAQGNLKGALEEFNLAVALDPNLDNLIQRGATYQMVGQHKLAIADFDKAIRYGPSGAAYFARSASKRALGDIKGAEEDHKMARLIDSR